LTYPFPTYSRPLVRGVAGRRVPRLGREDIGVSEKIDDDLWEQFHEVVNMTSRELEDWLRESEATPDTEPLPDQAGSPAGRQVLAVLGKRRGDLTPDDADVMRAVVDRVRTQRGEQPEPTAGSAAWRHSLMGLGHDPLKPDGIA
jgi:Protein of unknown function (DUF3140)